MQTCTAAQALQMIREANGRFFNCKFVKKDNTLRSMTARLGVTKHLKGGVNTVANKPEYITVYEPKEKSYKNVNLSTMQELKIAGKQYKIVG